MELFFNRLGHDKLILQHDAEHAVGAVAKALQRHLGSARVKVRSAPVKSHQSQGSVESANAFVAGQIRTLWASLKHRYPELEPTHNVMPWLIRHASWLIARYHVRARDKLTPYKITQGVDYNKPICQFGEVIMGKVAEVCQGGCAYFLDLGRDFLVEVEFGGESLEDLGGGCHGDRIKWAARLG